MAEEECWEGHIDRLDLEIVGLFKEADKLFF